MFYDYFGGKSVFPDFRKNRTPDPDFFSLKPSRDQDGANKKRLSQIGPAIPELLRHTQTDIHTYRQKPLLLCSIDCNASYLSTTYFDKHA